MDVARIAVRCIGAFIYLLTMTRLSGKRVVSQATPFDFVVALIVGDCIDDALWAEVSMAKFAVGAGSIFVLDAIVKVVAFHWPAFHRFVNGTPTVVVRDGYELGDELRKEQLNEGDVAHLLRREGFDDWADVHLAVLDRDHEISVILKPEAEPLTKGDLA